MWRAYTIVTKDDRTSSILYKCKSRRHDLNLEIFYGYRDAGRPLAVHLQFGVGRYVYKFASVAFHYLISIKNYSDVIT